MRCPRCSFAGTMISGQCARCQYRPGLVAAGVLTGIPPQPTTDPLPSIVSPHLMRGDVLHKGRYRLHERVTLPRTQQGQGSAWLASDALFSRRTVLIRQVSIPPGTVQDQQEVLAGLLSRFRTLALRRGFPAIIDVFYERGSYQVVQEQPEGETLATLIQQYGTLPEGELATYGQQICELLSFLSQQSPPVVHGGISPQTLLVAADKKQVYLLYVPLFEPSLKPGRPGPVGFLAPEQIRGEHTASSDLYSVAASLHYAVTGYDPQERLAFFYPPARRLNQKVSVQMEQVLVRQLRLSVKSRYASAEEMQQQLVQIVTNQPQGKGSSAPQLPGVQQVWPREPEKIDKQRRGLLRVAAGGVAVATVLGAMSLTWFARPGRRIIRDPFAGQPDIAGWTFYTYKGHTNIVQDVAWSPNSSLIASASNDKTVQVWDMTGSNEPLIYRDHQYAVVSITWSPDGTYIASGGNDLRVRIWEADTGQTILTYDKHPFLLYKVAWSPDGKRIASAGSNVHVWDPQTGSLLTKYEEVAGPSNPIVYDVAWSPDSKWLASCHVNDDSDKPGVADPNHLIAIWDAATGYTLLTLDYHYASYTVTWSPDGKSIATAGSDHNVRVWDAQSGKLLHLYSGHTGYVYKVAWSPDGKHIASASHDSTVRIWDVATGELSFIYGGHTEDANSVSWFRDGKHLASAGADKVIKIWQAL